MDYRCDCSCTDFTQTNSSRCNSAGTYSCGMCGCEPGHLGARCECEEGEVNHQYLSACREAEGKQVCSGRGECSCNQCLCYESEFGKIYGTFCECDDFSCARHKGILCSGKKKGFICLFGCHFKEENFAFQFHYVFLPAPCKVDFQYKMWKFMVHVLVFQRLIWLAMGLFWMLHLCPMHLIISCQRAVGWHPISLSTGRISAMPQ